MPPASHLFIPCVATEPCITSMKKTKTTMVDELPEHDRIASGRYRSPKTYRCPRHVPPLPGSLLLVPSGHHVFDQMTPVRVAVPMSVV